MKMTEKKQHQIKDRLERYGELQSPAFYVMDDRKLIYISVPKAACTSLKLTMAASYGIHVEDADMIHTDAVWQSQMGRPTNYPSDYRIFSFVRNPYARLVSCYRDKAVPPGKDHSESHLSAACHDRYPYFIPANISFPDFVHKVIMIPDALADMHFKSQSAILMSRGELVPHFIGRVETIKKDWEVLVRQYGFSPHIIRANQSTGGHSSTNYQSYYTEELAQLVYKRYHNDFDLFGYSEKLEDIGK